MRIAHVIDYFQPEIGYQEAHLARAQLEAGHEVQIITSDRTFPFQETKMVEDVIGARIRGTGRFEECGFDVVRLPIRFECMSRAWLQGLRSALENYAPDVVICHGLGDFTSLRVGRVLRSMSARLIVDDHMQCDQLQQSLVARTWHRLQKFMIGRVLVNRTERFVGVTPNTLRVMTHTYGVPKEKQQLVSPLALGWMRRLMDPRQDGEPAEAALDQGDTLFGYVGRIAPEKKLEDLIALTHELGQEGHEFSVLILGSGDDAYQAQLRAQVEQLTLGERVHFRPPVQAKEVPQVLAGLDAAVWPGGLSATMLDVFSAGAILVIPNHPGTRFYLTQGGGCTFSSRSELKDILREIVSDAAYRTRLKTESLANAQRFDWPQLSESLLNGEGFAEE